MLLRRGLWGRSRAWQVGGRLHCLRPVVLSRQSTCRDAWQGWAASDACSADAPQRVPSRPTSTRLPAGSVRSLVVHPQAPVLTSVGLDRYLRLHSVHSRQLLAKVYLKTLPTGAVPPAACRCLLPASCLPPTCSPGPCAFCCLAVSVRTTAGCA